MRLVVMGMIGIMAIVGAACGGEKPEPVPTRSLVEEHADPSTLPFDGQTPAENEDDAQAANSSAALPGQYFPPQGRSHFSYAYDVVRPPMPFCPGVPRSSEADQRSNAEMPPTSPPGGSVQTGNTTPSPDDCYNSNPPSSGAHLGMMRDVDLGNGVIIRQLPPTPDVYPPQIEIPREAIPHILEHAHFFVGYNCGDADEACQRVVAELEDLVNDGIDNSNYRIVMANDSDLPEGTVAVASWTRVLRVPYAEFDAGAFMEFFSAHNCRIDFEGFCT